MISSLKSKFDRSLRRAIFLSTDKLSVYHWENGKLGSSYLFDVSDDGRAYFNRYLKETGRISTYLLVDVVEEEYRQETVPHVFGKDRDAVIERKKARLFRDTPYYYADVQEREKGGRRDDNVLFTALTNPELLQPWIQLLRQNKIPLAGIYSLPQLSKTLLPHLPEPADNILLVSMQSISGLRQTFFKNGKLKVSRLVELPRYGTEPYAPIISTEVENINRYLNNLHLIETDEKLNVYYIGDAKLISEIRGELKLAPSVRNIFLNLNEFSRKTGFTRDFTIPFSDQLFIYLLLKKRPSNYYALKEETLYFRMQKIGRAMYISSLLLVFTGLIWGGLNFINAAVYRQQAEIASKKTTFYSDRYQLAREKLPETPVAPADLEVAVNIADTLQAYKSDPFPVMKLVSRAMDVFPLINMEEINWATSSDPNSRITNEEEKLSDKGLSAYTDIGSEQNVYDYYHIAVMKGAIKPFDGDYRKALDMINNFATELRSLENIRSVNIISLPLDISSEANLQGASNSLPGEAAFSIRIVMGVKHEV